MYVCADTNMCVYYVVVVKKVLYLSKSTGARTFRSPFFKTLVLLCNNIHGRRILDAVYLCVFVVVVFTEGRPKRFLLPLLLLVLLMMSGGGGCLQHMMMAIACI